MTFINRSETRTRNTQLIAGINKRFTALSTIPLNGAPFTPVEVVAIFQAEMDTADAVVPARAAWRAKVAAAKAAKEKAEAIRPDLEQFVRMNFGADPAALGDFGLEAKPPRDVPAATKAVSVEKAKATRAAGGAKAVKKAKAAQADATPQPAAPAPAPGTPSPTPSKS